MPIYCNVEGEWKRFPEPSAGEPLKVYDSAIADWVPLESVYVFTQGEWRSVWPSPPTTTTLVTVDATGGVWPATGSVTVAIESRKTAASPGIPPVLGTVTVTSGAWSQSFPAIQGTSTFPLPERNAGTYTVHAVWSEDAGITGTDDYTIMKADPIISLTPATQTIRSGGACQLTTTVNVGSMTLPTGGYTEVRRQTTTSGPWSGWHDASPYIGVPVTRTVRPEVSVMWATRVTGHPNVNEGYAEATTWVEQQTAAYSDVEAVAARTYSHGGTRIRRDGYDVYHGEYDETYGRNFGFIWFPALPSDKSCRKVEILWYPEYTWVSASEGGRMALGHHGLDTVPDTVNPFTDDNIDEGIEDIVLTRGRELWIDCPWLVSYVNTKRAGGFGIVVGGLSDSPIWYGYGRPLIIRYHWERWD